jgi:hypothetical protein
LFCPALSRPRPSTGRDLLAGPLVGFVACGLQNDGRPPEEALRPVYGRGGWMMMPT